MGRRNKTAIPPSSRVTRSHVSQGIQNIEAAITEYTIESCVDDADHITDSHFPANIGDNEEASMTSVPQTDVGNGAANTTKDGTHLNFEHNESSACSLPTQKFVAPSTKLKVPDESTEQELSKLITRSVELVMSNYIEANKSNLANGGAITEINSSIAHLNKRVDKILDKVNVHDALDEQNQSEIVDFIQVVEHTADSNAFNMPNLKAQTLKEVDMKVKSLADTITMGFKSEISALQARSAEITLNISKITVENVDSNAYKSHSKVASIEMQINQNIATINKLVTDFEALNSSYQQLVERTGKESHDIVLKIGKLNVKFDSVPNDTHRSASNNYNNANRQPVDPTITMESTNFLTHADINLIVEIPKLEDFRD
ncbi:unnamed protein product [Allacma fusca]|uniref:Uncharacterized protein n=1 Tax=Allacma fusca TaxID=39272 RepID=A0A8J2NVZ6_9HEXA|nr:unnamed protein product [Allacma fusca]